MVVIMGITWTHHTIHQHRHIMELLLNHTYDCQYATKNSLYRWAILCVGWVSKLVASDVTKPTLIPESFGSSNQSLSLESQIYPITPPQRMHSSSSENFSSFLNALVESWRIRCNSNLSILPGPNSIPGGQTIWVKLPPWPILGQTLVVVAPT